MHCLASNFPLEISRSRKRSSLLSVLRFKGGTEDVGVRCERIGMSMSQASANRKDSSQNGINPPVQVSPTSCDEELRRVKAELEVSFHKYNLRFSQLSAYDSISQRRLRGAF